MKQDEETYPEGGYGWIIVIASSLSSFVTLSIIQSFGMVLKVTFAESNLSATQIALVISMNGAFGMLVGPLIAQIQKMCGCRKAAFLAAFLTSAGIILTSLSNNFTSYVFFHGMITSLGLHSAESTQRLAVNTYFRKKRSLVTGFILTFAGLAPILIPQLFRFLLKVYTSQQTTLIYAGICAHLFVSAMLLQPVEWHQKKYEEMVEFNPVKKPKNKFDFDLLKDPVFDNIILGLSLVTFAEMSFTLLLPFILHDSGLNVDQVAIFLSVLGLADLISRFVSPGVGHWMKKSSRFMFAMSVAIVTIVKTVFIFCEDYNTLLTIAVVLGWAKGLRKVYMWLVVPDYVPLEKLPTAAGIDLLLRGVCILTGGALVGVLRDITGNYASCILVMNAVMLVTLLLWTGEAIIMKRKNKF
ncbi:Monocarboxylate transporter 6-like Protein [Tribolium castaneum]|uniref:Monocarboxylate transporter 6-like Protein n=1 Tax=Tribolium castaneum TaxID=7070 RepID=A0A139WJR6_TRICA|nr:PREDICTED: monocarboxylate transporter 13-like [Tribolium castaneum]KYB28166.1 Monocarboxylate transporter 6-like Protein [Tribolium castaneum]|eukprot:XP_015834494.1 PREDICTED: monocarboxylate transporter 13-like [Tribolium castaneum]